MLPGLAAFPSDVARGYIVGAIKVCDRYIGRELYSQSRTGYFDGPRSAELPLPSPLTAVASVYLDYGGYGGQAPNAFPAESALTQGVDYYADYNRSMLTLLRASSGFRVGFGSGEMPRGPYSGRGLVGRLWEVGWGGVPGSVKVTYTSGYTTAPEDLLLAVSQVAAWTAAYTETGGVANQSVTVIDTTESSGGGMAVVDALRGGMPALGSARQILDSYRGVRWGSTRVR